MAAVAARASSAAAAAAAAEAPAGGNGREEEVRRTAGVIESLFRQEDLRGAVLRLYQAVRDQPGMLRQDITLRVLQRQAEKDTAAAAIVAQRVVTTAKRHGVRMEEDLVRECMQHLRARQRPELALRAFECVHPAGEADAPSPELYAMAVRCWLDRRKGFKARQLMARAEQALGTETLATHPEMLLARLEILAQQGLYSEALSVLQTLVDHVDEEQDGTHGDENVHSERRRLLSAGYLAAIQACAEARSYEAAALLYHNMRCTLPGLPDAVAAATTEFWDRRQRRQRLRGEDAVRPEVDMDMAVERVLTPQRAVPVSPVVPLDIPAQVFVELLRASEHMSADAKISVWNTLEECRRVLGSIPVEVANAALGTFFAHDELDEAAVLFAVMDGAQDIAVQDCSAQHGSMWRVPVRAADAQDAYGTEEVLVEDILNSMGRRKSGRRKGLVTQEVDEAKVAEEAASAAAAVVGPYGRANPERMRQSEAKGMRQSVDASQMAPHPAALLATEIKPGHNRSLRDKLEVLAGEGVPRVARTNSESYAIMLKGFLELNDTVSALYFIRRLIAQDLPLNNNLLELACQTAYRVQNAPLLAAFSRWRAQHQVATAASSPAELFKLQNQLELHKHRAYRMSHHRARKYPSLHAQRALSQDPRTPRSRAPGATDADETRETEGKEKSSTTSSDGDSAHAGDAAVAGGNDRAPAVRGTAAAPTSWLSSALMRLLPGLLTKSGPIVDEAQARRAQPARAQHPPRVRPGRKRQQQRQPKTTTKQQQ